jgi:hypothetical protein
MKLSPAVVRGKYPGTAGIIQKVQKKSGKVDSEDRSLSQLNRVDGSPYLPQVPGKDAYQPFSNDKIPGRPF